MIGLEEISTAALEQRELFERVAARVEPEPFDGSALHEYAGNIGVDFQGLAQASLAYLQANESARDNDTLALACGAACRFFLLGVILGREHRP